MAWLDDRIRDHPKIARVSDRAFKHWVLALCYCSAHNTRGRLDDAIVVLRVPKPVRQQLVEIGLWDEDEEGLWVHDWDVHNGQRDAKIAAKRTFDSRRQQLMRDPELRAAIRGRDGDHCRYCGREVNWSDRKGAAGATYDHVDPNGPNELANLVVCCRSCNSSKRGRTPEAAGIKLRPAPASSSDLSPDLDHGSDPDLDPPRGRAQGRSRAPAGARPNDHHHDHDQEPSIQPSEPRHASRNGRMDGDLERINPTDELERLRSSG